MCEEERQLFKVYNLRDAEGFLPTSRKLFRSYGRVIKKAEISQSRESMREFLSQLCHQY